ncbi:MAG: putative zinc-binding metallopeptidase [Rubrivivax sp.]|nr:putative zinc-binding metallopeptidase [Rubrivivax sp.]
MDAADRGLAFDLLQSLPNAAPVTTGHADGAVTLDVEEADDATREARRARLHEPYRTVLGHLRHEVGHYYWQRLVEGSAWQAPFRALFGDERADYGAALARHYDAGPAADWAASHVSAYAASHPWEDWAETWAHYLHIVDALDTARSFGLDGEQLQLGFEPYDAAALGATDAAGASFVELLNGWMELAGVLNELARSMGQPDFYPFVLSAPAVRKLQFVHRVVQAASADSREDRGSADDEAGDNDCRGGADDDGRGGAAGGSAIGG